MLLEPEEASDALSKLNPNKTAFHPTQSFQLPPPPLFLQNPAFADPSPGFNADFLLQPSMRKGSSTFSEGKKTKARVYTVDEILQLRPNYQGEKRLKIPIAKPD